MFLGSVAAKAFAWGSDQDSKFLLRRMIAWLVSLFPGRVLNPTMRGAKHTTAALGCLAFSRVSFELQPWCYAV